MFSMRRRKRVRHQLDEDSERKETFLFLGRERQLRMFTSCGKEANGEIEVSKERILEKRTRKGGRE